MNASRLFALLAASALAAFGAAQEISFAVSAAGTTSKLPKAQVFVIRSAAQYNAYLKQTGNVGWMKRSPVDFKKRQMVAIHMGPFPSGGQTVQLKRLRRVGKDRVEAQVVLQRPRIQSGTSSGGSMFSNVRSKPYVIASTPRFAGRVVLRVLGG